MNPQVASDLIRRIERLGEDDSDHTDELLEFVEHDLPEVRNAAVWALWTADLIKCYHPLVRHASTDPDETVRGSSVAMLGRYIYEGMMLEDDTLRSPLADKIRTVSELLRSLVFGETSPDLLRRRALEALSYNTDDQLESTIAAWMQSIDPLFRKSAAFAIGRADIAELSPLLIPALDDAWSMVRLEAIRSVGELGLKPAAAKLIALAKGEDKDVALEAIVALGLVGGAKAEAALKTLIRSGDKVRADRAKEALAELMGEE